jgi:hypothetical protein
MSEAVSTGVDCMVVRYRPTKKYVVLEECVKWSWVVKLIYASTKNLSEVLLLKDMLSIVTIEA